MKANLSVHLVDIMIPDRLLAVVKELQLYAVFKGWPAPLGMYEGKMVGTVAAHILVVTKWTIPGVVHLPYMSTTVAHPSVTSRTK